MLTLHVVRAVARHACDNADLLLPTVPHRAADFFDDFDMRFDSGFQGPGISVFTLQGGLPQHHYSTVLAHGLPANPGGRGLDLFSPVWQILDILPKGRGSWCPSFEY